MDSYIITNIYHITFLNSLMPFLNNMFVKPLENLIPKDFHEAFRRMSLIDKLLFLVCLINSFTLLIPLCVCLILILEKKMTYCRLLIWWTGWELYGTGYRWFWGWFTLLFEDIFTRNITCLMSQKRLLPTPKKELQDHFLAGTFFQFLKQTRYIYIVNKTTVLSIDHYIYILISSLIGIISH